MPIKANIQLKNLDIYKQIVEHMTESLLILDEKDDIIYANHIFCDLVGYNASEIIGMNQKIFFNYGKKEEKDKDIHFETNIKTINGDYIPVLCKGTHTINGGIVFNISNLSELKALQEVEKELIQINKTKDEFISIVGHELRTPLTSIKGYLSMILDGDMGPITQEVRRSLYHSFNSSVRLIKLVNDILSIGKIESGKMEYTMEDLEIMPIIKSVYKDIYLDVSQKAISLKVDFDEDLNDFKINTDKDKLKQVLLNLLTNAIKFTNSKGDITIKVKKQKDKARFEIIDTGVGIPEDKLHILFDKFSQVESSLQRENTSGLGLGLSISKRFIGEFGSEIKVKSKVNKGSTFYFDLQLIN